MQEAVRHTLDACRRHGKVAAVGGAYRPKLYAGMGTGLMLIGNDLTLLLGALRQPADFVASLAAD